MKIRYLNNFGKFTQYDFAITQVIAEVDSDEHLMALEQGFLMINGIWRQCRSTRVQLSDTNYVLLDTALILSDFDYDQLNLINEQYLTHRNYVFHPADIHITNSDTIWGYYHADKLVAWSRIHNYNGARETAYFAWDTQNPDLRLGWASLKSEVAWAKSLGDEFLYLGPGYEACSKYKSQLKGFQWWTGSEWSTDSEAYCWLCERETGVTDFRQYEDLIYNAS